MFDETIIPNTTGFSNTHCLPIPKLNLQFLTAHDHLLRNFNLFRLETAHEIRGDLEDTIRRLDPKFDGASEKTVFGGWSKMGVAIDRVRQRQRRNREDICYNALLNSHQPNPYHPL